MTSHWYQTFFTGIALDLWRQAVTPEMTRADADFLWQRLGLKPGARVLDVPCGNGRHALELARRGCRMTGFDISGEFLEEARATATAEKLAADFFQGDMAALGEADLPGGADYAAAYCFGNSFGYLEHEDTLAFLRGVASELRPGGRFALETGVAAECILPAVEPRRWYQIGDVLMLTETRYDAERSRLQNTYTFIRDGVRDARAASQAVYTAAELGRMLRASGLTPEAFVWGTDGAAFQLGSPRLIIVARRE
jgi:SAM-dependent methyltransferase